LFSFYIPNTPHLLDFACRTRTCAEVCLAQAAKNLHFWLAGQHLF